ncbi:MAG: HYR domain-containing protein [Bacteroidota bacterium]
MNKPILLVRMSFCLILLTLGSLPLIAQLDLSVNRADAIYNVGETAFFQARATYTGTATYEIIYDNEAPVIESGTINLNANQTTSIPFRLDEAGVVICRVNLNNAIREAAAAFAPLEISPLEEEPSDFDSFWSSQRNLKNSLSMDPQLSYDSESSYQTTYKFSLSNIEGRRVYGYISVPKGSGPFPASITLPPYGTSQSVVGADTESAEKGGMIAVSLSVHNRPVDQDDPNAYQPDDNTDRDKFYYRYALIGATHVIDYLETRPDFDGNVCAMGVSQGGGLSILLAGIDNRVSLLINSNPTMGQHVGYKYDRAAGFPYYLSIIDDTNQGNSSVFNAGVNATKYYDAMFHARRFKGASYSLTGMKDLVVPSATALVAHNQLSGSKVLMISRDGGHDHPNEYWNGRFEFMRRHFAGSNTPPFPFGSTNKGFVANAGDDQTVGTSANLTGTVFYDNDQLNGLNVNWTKVSGPGNVNFSNANGYNTNANFSTNGTYVVRFTARDDRKLNGEGKVYFISDDVQINVTGGGNPTFTLNFSCPSDQSVQIPAGQSQTSVSWNEPTASSNCSGGASYFQLAGPPNGSSFAQGTYTISYRASDNCGNQEDCSFTITVTEEAVTNPSNITLNCPSDIVVNAGAGDNAVTVSWAEPNATTTCTTGSNNSGGGDCSSTFKNGYSYMGTFDNSQFYLSNNGANWKDAQSAAESAGGRLAIINSAEENDFIQQNINNEIVFIGLSDEGQEGVFQWVDGSAVSYSKFVSSLNNSGDNDYITLYPWNGEWDLNNQFVTKKYVLEVPCGNGGGGGNGLTVTQTEGNANGSNFPIGITTVTYNATDACGNTATCSFNVTVNSTATNLSINCPSDISVQIPAGQFSTSVSWNPATASSNCSGGATVTQIVGNGNGTLYGEGNYTITYEATDNCGNQETCSFNITVSAAPTNLSISCPSDISVQLPVGQSTTTVLWDPATASSNCPNGATVTQIAGNGNGNQFGVGNYTVTYQASDNCGNQEICSFNISVTSTPTNLSISCPADQVLQIPAGQSQTQIDWSQPTANTSCPNGATVNQIAGPDNFSQAGAGTYTITYEATDECGNSETCSFTVTVNQTATNLTISCPPNQTIELPNGQTSVTLNWDDPTATSNCGNTDINQIGGTPKFSTLGIGTYFISYEATDNCSNRETCSFVITVEQGTPPNNDGNISLQCPNNITQTIGANESSATIFWNAPTASTTCTTSSGGGGDCNNNPSGDYTYLGEFEGSQYYKSNAPLNWALANEAAADEGGFIAKITSAEENEFIRSTIGTDLCIIGVSDEAQEGVWEYADGTAASYLNFPNGINNTFSDDYAVINFWNGEWELTTDFIYKKYVLEIPCGGGNSNIPSEVSLNQTAGPTSGSSFGVGTTTITYQATDDCGNVETCSFTVTIDQEQSSGGNDGPPTAVVSVANTNVTEDFEVSIVFNEPVTSLSGYDLSISNANWYGFTESNGTNFTVTLDPINEGTVTISVPANVAYDSDINGNLASNTVTVNYQNGSDSGGSNNPPMTSSSCIIEPFAVTIEDGGTVGGNVSNLINGIGLDVPNDLSAQHGGGSLYEGVWLNNGTSTVLRFDLGQTQIIDGIALWNYTYHTWLVLKRRGIKSFQVSTSTDGVNFSNPTFHTATQTTARGEKELAQIFNFPQVSARYVRLTVFDALDDSFYVGLGEVRFLNNCPLVSVARSKTTASIDQSAAILDKNDGSLNVEVFPNPTNASFFLDLHHNALATARIQVFNEIGTLVANQQIDQVEAAPIEVDLSHVASGLYFVRVVMDGELAVTKRIIKMD